MPRGHPLLLPDDLTSGKELRPGCTMDCAVHAPAAKQRGIGGIDDNIDVKRSDVAENNLRFNSHFASCRQTSLHKAQWVIWHDSPPDESPVSVWLAIIRPQDSKAMLRVNIPSGGDWRAESPREPERWAGSRNSQKKTGPEVLFSLRVKSAHAWSGVSFTNADLFFRARAASHSPQFFIA
jgi:hypothetical protein